MRRANYAYPCPMPGSPATSSRPQTTRAPSSGRCCRMTRRSRRCSCGRRRPFDRISVVREPRSPMRYAKFRWDEDRGDQYSAWGGSWWYFETGADGYVRRQIEVYDSGVQVRYGPDHQDDEYGGLSEVHHSELDRPADQELSAAEFESLWKKGPWRNN